MKLKLLLIILGIAPLPFATPGLLIKITQNFFFKIRYLGFSEVTGRFKTFYGSAELDESHKSLKSFELFIYTSLVDTSNSLRDSHLKRSDLLIVKFILKFNLLALNL